MKGKFESIPEILANCSNNGTLPMILSILQYGNCTSGNVKKKTKVTGMNFSDFLDEHTFFYSCWNGFFRYASKTQRTLLCVNNLVDFSVDYAALDIYVTVD